MKRNIAIIWVLTFCLSTFAAVKENDNDLALKDANEKVAALLNSTEVASKQIYCVTGKLDCRTHYYLKDKVTGNKVDSFYVTFVSADRQKGTIGYFMPVEGQPGIYHRFEDMTFDGVKLIEVISDNAEIEKYADGTVSQFKNVRIPKVATTHYIIGNINITEENVEIVGTEYDSADASFTAPFKLVYNRFRP